jgi:hypothetical protein
LHDPIRCFVGASVVVARRLHKTKVHEEFGAAAWDSFSGFSGRLFPDVGLLFEVYVLEGMVLKDWRRAFDVFQEDI